MNRWSWFVFTGLLFPLSAYPQDTGRADMLFYLEIPDRLVIPANIFLLNTNISLLPDKTLMFDLNQYPGYAPVPQFIPDLGAWQKDFVRRNGLDIIPWNGTIMDGKAMSWLIDNPSALNQELYYQNLVMNQRAVGNTQLQRMNVRMREIRYFDFIGIGKLGILYMVDPQMFQNQMSAPLQWKKRK